MADETAESNLADVEEAEDFVAAIAKEVADLSTGDRAVLRRAYLTRASGSRSRMADGIVVRILHSADISPRDQIENFEAWKLFMHIAALLSGTGAKNPHSTRARLGDMLHAAGVSEKRFLRLTAARGPSLHDQLRLTAQLLARSGKVPVDLRPVLRLARHAKDDARIRVAQDYYSAVAKAERDRT